jgi:hypothetical protein
VIVPRRGQRAVDSSRATLLSCAAALVAIACADDPGVPVPEVERPAAVVGGVPISTGEVRAEMEAAGGTAREALDRVIRRELLLAYARRNDLVDHHAPLGAERRAMVQELLERRVEREITAADISDEDVRRAFEDGAERFRQPERRTVIHFLAELTDESSPEEVTAASELAASVLAQAIAAPDPSAVFYTRADGVPRTRVEDLGTFARDANFVEPFRAPVFAAPSAGVIPETIRTEFGVHVVWLVRILPADDVPYELAAPILRRELLVRRRADALASLEASLAEGTEIAIDEARLRGLPDDFERGER